MNYRSIFIATIQTVGLFLCGLFIPILAWMITPVPLILAYVRNSRLNSLTALGLSTLITTFIAGWHIAIFLLLIFGMMAVTEAESLLRKLKPEISILAGALPSVAIVGFVMAYYFIHTGKNPFAVVETYIQGERAEALKLYGNLGFKEVVDAISSIPDASIHYFVLLLPCILTLAFVSIAACSYAITRSIIIRKPGSGPILAPAVFASWHAPDTWVWGLIAALALFLVPAETAKIAGWNLVIPFATLYLIQGVALMDYFLKAKLHLHPMVRILIHSIILSLPSILFVIVIGIVDIWADFRKLRGPVQKV
jgi:uncharacterized protein YybS (DUF2232 family)